MTKCSISFHECRRYISPSETANFLDSTIQSRISVRLIAEQHISISRAQHGGSRSQAIGVVNSHCSPADMVKMCASFVTEMCEATFGASPTYTIDGSSSASFACVCAAWTSSVTEICYRYVPVHLEYILTEVLKNSFRATVEHYIGRGPASMPNVVVTIAGPTSADPSRPEFLSLRIRDEGGGVSPENMPRVFSYAFSTAGASGHGSSTEDDGAQGGPYAAQHIGGLASVGGPDSDAGGGDIFGEISSRGMQVGVGTIAGLGYG